MLIQAAYLLNPDREPIPDAAVWIQGDRILYAGERSHLPAEADKEAEPMDLKDHVIAPGLVNAHCHLELTCLEGLAYPGSFVAWVREVLGKKNRLANPEQGASIRRGVGLALRGGTTAIGDHLSVTGDLETALNCPLRGRVFLEILGVNPDVAEDLWAAALSLLHAYENYPSRMTISLTPHSV
ncbi:MAG: amidohydrolase family protein, partial [Candidatus Binatia bacterium]